MSFVEWCNTEIETKMDWRDASYTNSKKEVGKLFTKEPSNLIDFIEMVSKTSSFLQHKYFLKYIKDTELPVSYGHALSFINETLNDHVFLHQNYRSLIPHARALIPDLAASWSTDGHVESFILF